MIEIVFLGTSAMAPTKERNHSSFFLRRERDCMLFDCGEGTQRQIRIAGINPQKISDIFITHWHGDHVLGLPGLIQTLGAQGYKNTLKIFGPEGTKEKVEALFKIFPFEATIDYEVYENKEGIVKETDDLVIKAYKLNHSVPCFGYRFEEKDKYRILKSKLKEHKIEEGPHLNKLLEEKKIIYEGREIRLEDVSEIRKGKVIGYISDTKMCDNVYKIAENCDLLISESTYSDEDAKKAEDYMHLTASQVAEIAKGSNSKSLILTHFSQRYLSAGQLLKEAKNLFENTKAAYDFMKLKI